MENTARYGRALHSHLSSSLKQRRSGYEPSDTETEWQDSPWREPDQKIEDLDQYLGSNVIQEQGRNKIHLNNSPQKATMLSPTTQRRHSRSDFESRRNVSPFSRSEHRRINGNNDQINPDSGSIRRTVSPFSRSERPRYRRDDVHKPDSETRRNLNLFPVTEHRRHISPYKPKKQDNNYSRRAASAPRARLKEYENLKHQGDKEQKRADRNPSPLPRNTSRNLSGGEINEMLANAKISKTPPGFDPTFESTESIAPGDIFFSKDYTAFNMQDSIFSRNGDTDSKFSQRTETYTERNPASSVVSRQTSNLSEFSSSRTNGSTKKFVSNRQKNQTEAWFSCIKKGSCRSKKSPEKERPMYEASVIEKAYVVESLREFWADKYRPCSLSGFICHKQEALQLKQLVRIFIPFSTLLLPQIIPFFFHFFRYPAKSFHTFY